MKTQFLILCLLCIVALFSSCQKEEEKLGPIAEFSVNPPEGYVTTNFIFDGSGSQDQETPVSDLEFRWDWDGDGKWDTPFSNASTATHKFPTDGNFEVRMEVVDGDGWTDSFRKTITVLPDTTPPLAMFEVLPSQIGDINTIFKFDASNTINMNKTNGDVQIRWDWEGDGIWDTGYRSDPQAYHRYIVPGTYQASLEVIDDENLTNIARITVVISQ